MTIFSGRQLRRLNRAVDEAAIYRREKDGKELRHVTAWYAISEANRIFGYGGWDRETVLIEKVFEKTRFDVTTCAYMAKVRVTVRGPFGTASREGTGFGQANQSQAGEAHEKAIKSAETDATKRALATFGPRFGLSLYRPALAPKQEGVSSQSAQKEVPRLCLVAPNGEVLEESLSPEGFVSGFRQLADKLKSVEDLDRLQKLNAESANELANIDRAAMDSRRNLLDELISNRKKALSPPPLQAPSIPLSDDQVERVVDHQLPAPIAREVRSPSRVDLRLKVDKSMLAYGATRRIRNRGHLDYVASRPCLVCEETGCHAHHVTYAQPRGLSVKVSDEFTVPLCAVHHNQVHQSGAERSWWASQGVDPLQYAEALWEETLRSLVAQPGTTP